MQKFTDEELKPIEAQLEALPEGAHRQAALIKAIRWTEEADAMLKAGQALPETTDPLCKAVQEAVTAMHQRETGAALRKSQPLGLGVGRSLAGKLAKAERFNPEAWQRARDEGRVKWKRIGRSPIPDSGLESGAAGEAMEAARWADKRADDGIRQAVRSGKSWDETQDSVRMTGRAWRKAARNLSERRASFAAGQAASAARRAKIGKYGAMAAGAAAVGAAGYGAYRYARAEKAAPAEQLQKALAALPLSQRGLAEDLIRLGDEDALAKAFPAAIVAAARGLWTAAKVGGAAGMARDAWRAGSAAAGRVTSAAAGAGRAGMAGLRGGMAGKTYSPLQARAYGAGSAMRGAGKYGADAAATMTTRFGPKLAAGARRAWKPAAAGAGAAGLAGGGYAMGRGDGRQAERANNPFLRNQQRRSA